LPWNYNIYKEMQFYLTAKNARLYDQYSDTTARFRGEKEGLMPPVSGEGEEVGFAEFRRKIRGAEVLSAAMERLLSQIQFNGRVSVITQNGRVLKSGYEEGYFRHHPAT